MINKEQKQGKINYLLDKKINTEYGLITKKEWIEKLRNAGALPEIKEKVDWKAKDKAVDEICRIRMAGKQNIQAKRIEELNELIDNPPIKNEYRILTGKGTFYVITKTEYDYANQPFLQEVTP
jgi:hypothetical protein